MNEEYQMPDPWQSAEEAKEPPKVYFGQIHMDVHFCVLRKGQGKIQFDPQQHKPEERRTAIDLEIRSLPGGAQYLISRSIIAESRDWAGVVLPGIKALGYTPRQIEGKWVKAELVKTGRSYVKNGEEKEVTMPGIVAVYQTEEECRAAAEALFGNGGGGEPEPEPAPASGNGTNGSGDPARKTALLFLPSLVGAAWDRAAGQAGAFIEELTRTLANTPLIKDHFAISSPEVVAEIQKRIPNFGAQTQEVQEDDIPF